MKKTEKKKGLTVKVDGKISDGQGGYLRKGSAFEPSKGCDVEGLKARGLVG